MNQPDIEKHVETCPVDRGPEGFVFRTQWGDIAFGADGKIRVISLTPAMHIGDAAFLLSTAGEEFRRLEAAMARVERHGFVIHREIDSETGNHAPRTSGAIGRFPGHNEALDRITADVPAATAAQGLPDPGQRLA